MTHEERIRLEQGQRLAGARERAGYRSARAAALENNWPESTYRAHEAGKRTIGQDDAERYAKRFRMQGVDVTAQQILFDDADLPPTRQIYTARIMGYIGAGAEIMPEFEQVPPEGLDTIEVPFPVPDDIIALGVRGDSMLPVYRDGDAILVRGEQIRPTDSFVGEDAAVRTADGRRFLKEIQYGRRRGVYNLYSYNAKMIEDVRLEWVGEIWVTIKAQQIRRIAGAHRRTATRRETVRRQETAGMDELPLSRGK